MTFVQPFFDWLLQTTLIGSVVICLILLIQKTLGGRLGPRWCHALWLVLLMRMILPWAPSSRISLVNLIPSWDRQIQPQRLYLSSRLIAERQSFGFFFSLYRKIGSRTAGRIWRTPTFCKRIFHLHGSCSGRRSEAIDGQCERRTRRDTNRIGCKGRPCFLVARG